MKSRPIPQKHISGPQTCVLDKHLINILHWILYWQMQRGSWKQTWFRADRPINLPIPKHLLLFMHRGGSVCMENSQEPIDACKMDARCSM